MRGERSGQAAMNEGGSPSEEKIPNLSSFLPKICIFFSHAARVALRKERRQFVAYKLTRTEAPYLEGVISFVFFSKLLLLFIYFLILTLKILS